MNRLIWRTGAICGALVLSLGCSGEAENPPDVSAANVEQEAREAVRAASDYAAAQRRQLAERASGAIDEVERELAEARRELAELPEETREQLASAIDRAERAQTTLDREIDEFQEAGADRWETTQKRVSDALSEVAEARREITAALQGSDKPADAS
jgi:hypothetical protein